MILLQKIQWHIKKLKEFSILKLSSITLIVPPCCGPTHISNFIPVPCLSQTNWHQSNETTFFGLWLWSEQSPIWYLFSHSNPIYQGSCLLQKVLHTFISVLLQLFVCVFIFPWTVSPLNTVYHSYSSWAFLAQYLLRMDSL